MNTPKIDLDAVPGLETAQGLFGSLSQTTASYDDRIVDLMVFVYDVMPPEILT